MKAIITKPGHTYNCFAIKAQDFDAKNFKYAELPKKGDVCEIIATHKQFHQAPIEKGFVPYKQNQAWYHLKRTDGQDFIMGRDGFQVIEVVELDDDLFEI